MKILICHNKYQRFGGEDAVVASESKLLRDAGHEVEFLFADNSKIQGVFGKILAVLNVVYSRKSRQLLAKKIATFKPDIVHVHNFFPLLTPSLFDACRQMSVPVVQTLHNFRIVCPTALLMLDGKICEKSLKGSSWWAVPHKVYRGSFLGTLALVCMIEYHKKRGTWSKYVTHFISPSSFVRDKFIEGGLPADKITVKPNFTDMPDKVTSVPRTDRHGALFVGRLSPEKGLDLLINAWKRGIQTPISVLGDGPFRSDLEREVPENMALLGNLPPEFVRQKMQAAQFLIMTSKWYETFGLVLIEAFSVGLPAIVPKLGAMAELVVDGETGLYFEPGCVDSLLEKVSWAVEHPEEMASMGAKAKSVFQEKYSPAPNLVLLEQIYKETVQEFRESLNSKD